MRELQSSDNGNHFIGTLAEDIEIFERMKASKEYRDKFVKLITTVSLPSDRKRKTRFNIMTQRAKRERERQQRMLLFQNASDPSSGNKNPNYIQRALAMNWITAKEVNLKVL